VTVRPILADEVGRFNAELDAHHWLGHRLTGQVLRYVAVLDGEWVALVGFGSAALSCAARDRRHRVEGLAPGPPATSTNGTTTPNRPLRRLT
jgi:hypothetical protein